MDNNLNYCRESFEKSDYHHYLISLMMPADQRPALWTLGAFKAMVESIPNAVSNPTLGYMRLTWWRDQIALLEKGHVTKGQPLLSSLYAIVLQYPSLLPLLIETINDFEPSIEKPETDIQSAAYQNMLDIVLAAHMKRYRRLENSLTAILKKHHGTKWENNPPFMALRLWLSQFLG